jgi:hypothetical protein
LADIIDVLVGDALSEVGGENCSGRMRYPDVCGEICGGGEHEQKSVSANMLKCHISVSELWMLDLFAVFCCWHSAFCHALLAELHNR